MSGSDLFVPHFRSSLYSIITKGICLGICLCLEQGIIEVATYIDLLRNLFCCLGTLLNKKLCIQGFMYLFVDGVLANLSIELATYVVLKNTHCAPQFSALGPQKDTIGTLGSFRILEQISRGPRDPWGSQAGIYRDFGDPKKRD